MLPICWPFCRLALYYIQQKPLRSLNCFRTLRSSSSIPCSTKIVIWAARCCTLYTAPIIAITVYETHFEILWIHIVSAISGYEVQNAAKKRSGDIKLQPVALINLMWKPISGPELLAENKTLLLKVFKNKIRGHLCLSYCIAHPEAQKVA